MQLWVVVSPAPQVHCFQQNVLWWILERNKIAKLAKLECSILLWSNVNPPPLNLQVFCVRDYGCIRDKCGWELGMSRGRHFCPILCLSQSAPLQFCYGLDSTKTFIIHFVIDCIIQCILMEGKCQKQGREWHNYLCNFHRLRKQSVILNWNASCLHLYNFCFCSWVSKQIVAISARISISDEIIWRPKCE